MSHGPTFFPAKNYCIYCGSGNVPLTDEHIVPYSLGGSHVIRKASCHQCCKITSKIELKIARGLWGQPRSSYGAPTRRKKERSKYVEVPDSANLGIKRRVLSGDFPAALIFYRMPQAGILSGFDEDFDGSLFWKIYGIGDKDRPGAFEKTYGFKPALSFSHQPQEFGQLLLKIGYCQILTQLERDEFEPICLPYITGEKQNVSWLVGSDEGSVPLPDIGYSTQTSVIGYPGLLLLVGQIKLWANLEMPWYHAVVGRVTGAEKILGVLGKLGDGNQLDLKILDTGGS